MADSFGSAHQNLAEITPQHKTVDLVAGPVVASAACGLAASAASVAAGLLRTLWAVPGWSSGAQDAPYPLD